MIQKEEAGIPVPLFLGNGKTLGLISGADNCCRSSYGQEELEQQAQLADRVGYLIHAFKRKKLSHLAVVKRSRERVVQNDPKLYA